MTFSPTFLLIATGKYSQFVTQCTDSIKKYFPQSQIYLFGDTDEAQFKIKNLGFPYVTLYRFHYFNLAEKNIVGDYIYYMDIDARFVDMPDIKGDLVGVRHCGYYFDSTHIPMETNPHSVFYPYRFAKYYGGGFIGGNRKEFFKLSHWCEEEINKDAANKIIPRHNDETALNAYFSIHKPTLELTPDYHYPQNDDYFSERCWNGEKPFTPRILLLDKNHEEVRS